MPPVKGLLTRTADPGLFDMAGIQGPSVRRGPGRMIGTDTRVLFTALSGVFTLLGFDGLGCSVTW